MVMMMMMGKELLSEDFGGEEDSDHAVAVKASYDPFRWFVGVGADVGM